MNLVYDFIPKEIASVSSNCPIEKFFLKNISFDPKSYLVNKELTLKYFNNVLPHSSIIKQFRIKIEKVIQKHHPFLEHKTKRIQYQVVNDIRGWRFLRLN